MIDLFQLGYLDPGTGYTFTQSAPNLWVWALGGLVVFFRLAWQFWKRWFPWLLLALLLIIAGGWALMRQYQSQTTHHKVIVLGIDGMDPKICQRLMEAGRLPNLARLAQAGAFSPLATTTPAESAVAWTSFATGLNPGKHGIFDFVMRDPDTHGLYLSLNEAVAGKGGRVEIRARRQGKAFWTALSEQRVPSHIYFCPNTFPPEPVTGTMVSGMGVPDVTGLTGVFTFYTSAGLSPQDRDTRGRVVPLRFEGDVARAAIYGPALESGGKRREMEAPLTITRRPDGAELNVGGTRFTLQQGQWSTWIPVSFSRGFLQSDHGMVRLFLKQLSPCIEIYATPVNFDPRKPLFPISYPADHAGRLADRVGPYYTQGMPVDTWALMEGRIDADTFLQMCDDITASRKRMLDLALSDFSGGLLFFYLGCLDDMQHMFWRCTDPKSPSHDAASAHRTAIDDAYVKMDGVVGDVMARCGDAVLMVVSDHGFTAYRRSVNLNRWLIDHGYQARRAGVADDDPDGIDWSRTRAYATGFGGIYINLIGREYNGIVEESGAPALMAEIAKALRDLRDPQTNAPVVAQTHLAGETWTGPLVYRHAPDLYVGFTEGYRAAWKTCLGQSAPQIFDDNKKMWSGDHMVDPSLVPGVLFVNRRVSLGSPAIIDLAPTLLSLFGVTPPEGTDGKALFGPSVFDDAIGTHSGAK